MNMRRTSFAHPDAVALNARVQLEYAERYDDPAGDATPMAPEMFEPPHGVYLIGYDEAGAPVATGGWRAHDAQDDEPGHEDGDAEIKRMYVVPEARGRGLSRIMLTALEDDARAAGRLRMVLETGTEQPEAMALYESSGYQRCTKFGLYRNDPRSVCYAKPLNQQVSVPGPRTGREPELR